MNFWCWIFGHKMVKAGNSQIEWTSDGPALINVLEKPIDVETHECCRKNCDETKIKLSIKHFAKKRKRRK